MKGKDGIFHTVYGYNSANDPSKPYDACVGCMYINSAKCDGPNFLAMTPERRCEWLQRRRAFLRSIEPDKWNYDYVAEQSKVGKNTVISIFSDPTYSPRVDTLESVLRVMVNGSWGENPCPLTLCAPEIIYADSPETVRILAERGEQVSQLQNTLANIHHFYAEELDKVRRDTQDQIALLEDKNRWLEKIIDKLMKD
jgi:hypothetical protein